MGKLRTVMLAAIGVIAVGYAGKSMMSGIINAGGRNRDFFVTFADRPALFLFIVLVIMIIGVGALLIAWRVLTGREDA